MLVELLTSPDFTALANAIQVGTFLGVFWTLWIMYRDRQLITIIARCADGREREIGKIPRRFVTRAEVQGWVSKQTGPGWRDFRKFNPDYKFRDRKVVVELTNADFDCLESAS